MATKKKTRRKITSAAIADPVTAYAKAVVDGKIVAGPHVRNACARHLKDLKSGAKRGLKWDIPAALKAIGFFENVLKLSGGEFDGKPFLLADWQKFIVGSLFGWKGRDGYRRYRKAFIETGKGSGKSPLAAGIGLKMLLADGEPGAEVYAAATDKDQAKITFRDAVSMARQSPAISRRIRFSGGFGNEWNIAYLAKGAFFRPISSETKGRGKSGPRPHCVILDEIHEHPTDAMVEFLSKGVKGRRQPLIFMITNSGSDRQSVCYEYHEYGVKVCKGELEDDEFFAYICALDEGDDPFKDDACWIKANPNLGITFTSRYLEGEVRQARGMPSKQNITLRLNFCVWTESSSAWIGREAWQSCEADIDIETFAARDCYGGIDLSAKRDLTAVARVWPAEDGSYDAVVDFWTPGETILEREDRDRVPYRLWRDQGYLHTTPSKTVDYGFMVPVLAEMHAHSPFIAAAYDRWRIDLLKGELDEEGLDLPLVEFGQGFRDMGPAVDTIEEMILDNKLRVRINPVLRWNVASAVLDEDPAGNRKFAKQKATGRIDGLIALAMALAIAAASQGDGRSVYENRGILEVEV